MCAGSPPSRTHASTGISATSCRSIIDTDGIFFVHGSSGKAGPTTAIERFGPRIVRPCWPAIPATGGSRPSRSRLADLRQRPWTAVGLRTWTLTVATIDGRQHRVFLVHDEQAELARAYLPWLVGSRFVG